MKKETKGMVLKKPVQALVMVPKVGKLTVTARKLFNVILHTSQQQIAKFKIEGKVVPATHRFSARLRDLLDPIEVGNSDLRAVGKAIFIEMLNTQIEWDSPEAKKGRVWGVSHLLSEAGLVYVDNEITPGSYNNTALIAEWAFPPSIVETLTEPELYAQVNIYQIAKLTSYETLVLYEICTRYRSNHEGLTNRSNPEWWVRALSNKPPGLDPVTNEPKLRHWTKFKDDKIKKAIAEINKKTDLDIQLIEHKDGKKIVGVQFKVTRKELAPHEDISKSKSKSSKISSEIAEKAKKIGLSSSDVLSVVKKTLDEGVLNIGLSKVVERMERTDLPPIASKVAYLKTVLNDCGSYVESTPPVQATPVPLSSQAALSSNDQHRAESKIKILQLSKEVQLSYALRALEAFKAMGSRSPSLARAIDLGLWAGNRALMSKMTDIYIMELPVLDYSDQPV